MAHHNFNNESESDKNKVRFARDANKRGNQTKRNIRSEIMSIGKDWQVPKKDRCEAKFRATFRTVAYELFHGLVYSATETVIVV